MLRVARRMVELDPRDPRAYYLQAVLAARAGLDDLARRLMSRTGEAYADVPAGQLLAGILELRTGNAALAVERFDELARRQPANAAAALLFGRALLAHGEANEVVARFGPLADLPQASPYLLALVGRAYEQQGLREDAARYLDRAAGARPAGIGVLPPPAATLAAGADAEVAAIRRMLAEGRAGEARAHADRLRQAYPDSIDVDVLAGDVALLAGDPAAALAAYDRAARVRRAFALVERMVAAQRELGDEDAAVDRLAAYLAQNPRSAPASLMLGRMLAERGDARRAALLREHARTLAGVAADTPRAEGRVAALLARLGQASARP